MTELIDFKPEISVFEATLAVKIGLNSSTVHSMARKT